MGEERVTVKSRLYAFQAIDLKLLAVKSWQNNVSAELYILWYGGKLREYTNVCCAHLQTQHLLLFGNVGFGVSHYQELWRSLKVSLEWELEFKRLTLNQPRLEHIMGSSSSEVPWAPSWFLLSSPWPGSAVGFGVPLQVAFRALCGTTGIDPIARFWYHLLNCGWNLTSEGLQIPCLLSPFSSGVDRRG